MKVKSVAVALLAVLGVAAQAHATINNMGTLGVGDHYLSGSETGYVTVAPGSFEDVFNFHLAAISGLDGSAGTVNLGKFKILNSTFGYDLFAAGNTTSIAHGNGDDGFVLSGLSAGDYQLKVFGKATGTNGGHYNGLLTVSAVPEPESYAMFLAGLGLMAAVARRRSK